MNALTSVAEIANNSVYQNAVLEIRDSITMGQSLQDAMNNSGQFPTMVIQMIAVGEASGTIETMLNKIASYYEEDVDNIVSNLSNLVETHYYADIRCHRRWLCFSNVLANFQIRFRFYFIAFV